MSELAIIRMQGNAYQAMLSLGALADATGTCLDSRRIAHYLNCELGTLTGVLEDFKIFEPPLELANFADPIRHAFVQLQHFSSECCQRVGRSVRLAFRRMGSILYCLFSRTKVRLIARPERALSLRESDPVFRAALLDRIADALRSIFAWLRDLCIEVERMSSIPLGPVVIGSVPSRFVVSANTADGVLIMRFQDGHQELFNLTSAQWSLIMPLLVTNHELGHARLNGRPQSQLTRHDASGDELEGDIKRLKSYIHPVGRGRGGNGLYFLAPYPRQVNTVDK